MDKTALNAHLVTTRLKRGFSHLKSAVDQTCGKFLVWLPMKGMISLILLLVRHVFRGDELLVVFSDRRGIGTGWDGVRGGIEVCEVGAGKISPTPAGAGLNFANAERKQTKNFNPGRTLL